MAITPFWCHIVDDERAANPVDGPGFETVPSIVCRDKNHGCVEGCGHLFGMLFLAEIDVRPPLNVFRILRHIGQHGEFFHAQVGVWFQPKAPYVESILDSQVSASQAEAAAILDGVDQLSRLKGLGNAAAGRESIDGILIEKAPGIVMGFAAPARVVDHRRLKGQGADRSSNIHREQFVQSPMFVGRLTLFSRVESRHQAALNRGAGSGVGHGRIGLWIRTQWVWVGMRIIERPSF